MNISFAFPVSMVGCGGVRLLRQQQLMLAGVLFGPPRGQLPLGIWTGQLLRWIVTSKVETIHKEGGRRLGVLRQQ